jgi:hypothetical protein
MTRTVHVVPHTHWDREWYRPFQTFRMQLVDLLDGLLPAMAADPAYAHFMLDGQMAVVDDYLAMRPEAEPVLRKLAAAGRITMGPWYILMDEFLVSGETMIRDMQLGLDRAARFGGAMPVGYLPDMFGHVAQMPQLLAQFGFDHTVVWRGVPEAIDAPAFWWEAPDGTRVRATYLATGYSNGSVLPGDAKELVAQIDGWCREQGDRAGDPVLWMNGTDHLLPYPHLGRVVAEANGVQDDYRLEVTSLAHHVAAAAAVDGELPVWSGELRSGARANLLMGVASNRVDVHQAEMRTTRALEQIAEPLCALYLPADRWPSRFLDAAWLEVIRNCAHDSICACSVDEVGRAVIHRFDEARTIAEGLTDRAVAAIAATVGGVDPIAVNPSARPRSGLVELTVPGSEPPEGTQVVSVRPGRRLLTSESRQSAGSVVSTAIATVEGFEGLVVDERDGVLVIEIYIDGTVPPSGAHLDKVDANRAVHDAIAAQPDGMARVEIMTRSRHRVLARVVDVPGFGWARCRPEPLDVAPVEAVGSAGLGNGLVEVVVDPASGEWSLNGQPGYGRLIDGGDVGDTYNYCPPATDKVIDRPDAVSVEVLESGPLRGRIAIISSYVWPERAEADTRVGERTVEVRTTLELRAGEDLVRVRHELDNPCADHRLRALFPLPEPASTSIAESVFGTVERGLVAEGGPNEYGLPTFPSRRFVVAGGLTIAHDGLLEYELVDIEATPDQTRVARQLALTLLRCTGLISQGPMPYRPVPAGPQIETFDAQMRGPQTLEYVVATSGRDPYAIADDAFVPLIRARTRAGVAGLAGLALITPPIAPDAVDPSVDRGTPLTVIGAEVSAVTRSDGRVSVRVFNPSDEPTRVTIDGRQGWLVDLRGRTLEPFEGGFDLRPHGIATAVLS